MKRFVLVLAVLVGVFVGYRLYSRLPAQNPDPNHTHADFAVWVRGKQLDFSDPKFMSGFSHDETSHDEEGEYLDQYLHLHDAVGTVIHSHKPGLTLGNFFESLGVRFANKDGVQCIDFPQTGEACAKEGETWLMSVNGKDPVSFDESYVPGDTEHILIVLPDLNRPLDEQLEEYGETLSDLSCLYSRTCPWRGDPPAENCIADPAVPCTAPLD